MIPPPASNHLAGAASPYLRLHAANPVDWYPWGEEAFARARELDRPIFLSIGYFTCHWCHVMERESFSDPAIGELLNRNFVAIKVDREERPDVDRLYMSFVQATTGGGGWPLSAFLTPELEPFFGGTYFPPRDHPRLPGFARVLRTIADAWRTDRVKLLESATAVRRELARMLTPAREQAPASPRALLEEAWPKLFERYRGGFDAAHGGFGGAPKFPHPVALEFLLRYARRYRGTPPGAAAAEMVTATLGAMARGGIHDGLGGGFHRYSVDAGWRVPHFEKMLYDQAQLALVYLEAWQLTGAAEFAATARSTLDFVLREMRTPEGVFYSAQDADSPLPEDPARHGEGAYYLWTPEQIQAALPAPEAAAVIRHCQVEPGGNVPAELDPHGEFQGKNILQGGATPELAGALAKLYEVRRRRPHPPTDEKVLTAWNALMVSALARAAAAFGDAGYLAAAQRAGAWLWHQRWDGEVVRRTAEVEGFAEDYAFFVQAMLELEQADFDPAWAATARAVQRRQEAIFAAPEGGYFATRGDARLFLRLREDQDGAEPSANSIAAANLLRLEQAFPDEGWGERAAQVFAAFATRLREMPEALPRMAAELATAAQPARRATIAGDPERPETQALLQAARRLFLPGVSLARLPEASVPAGFVCEDRTCQLPISDPAAFAAALDS